MKFTDKAITKTKSFNCNAKTMWHKWSTHEGLKTFFGSDNKIELNPGGAFEIYFMMEAPVGLRGSERCKILCYIPEKMISFSWNAPPNIPYVRNHEYQTPVTVLFEEKEKSKILVTIFHHGWPEGKEWDESYKYFDIAWEQVLNSLEKSLKQ